MVKISRLLSLFAFSLMVFYKSSAQSNSGALVVKPVFGAHALVDQGQLLHDRLYGFDLAIQRTLDYEIPEWARIARVKSYGLELVVRNFDDFKGIDDTISNALGSAAGLLAQVEIKVIKIGKTEVVFTPALGVSYSTKTFFTNSQNRFIGSHINEMLKADVGAQITLNPKLSFLAGLGYVHLSNGGFLIPNNGLNTVNAYLGIKFKPSTGQTSADRQANSDARKSFQSLRKNTFEFMAGVGQRGVYEEKSAKYRSGFFAGYNYYINDFFTLKGGLDAVYYYTVFDPLQMKETFQNYGTSYDRWRAGVSIGPDFNFWRVAGNTQIGKYIHYNRYFENATWYWSMGATFYITSHIGIQAKTYMHFAQADFSNYGLVLRL